jgi:hypothetical protein
MRIKRTSGQGFDVLASRTDTIAFVKQRLGELTGRNTENMLLIYSGKEMEDGPRALAVKNRTEANGRQNSIALNSIALYSMHEIRDDLCLTASCFQQTSSS